VFGFERGAFTGAQQPKPGHIELAIGGVLFLDEVTEMRPRRKAKFLRLDRKDVTLVDRAAVRFLARAESANIQIVNCPGYVSSWIAAEGMSTEVSYERAGFDRFRRWSPRLPAASRNAARKTDRSIPNRAD
jgi:hypothetical protein